MFFSNPKISIIIPAYNTPEKLLKRAIDTIMSQTFKSWELLVINDGANETVKDIVKSYDNKKIRYFETKEALGGPARARNIGLKNAKGEYVFFHDHDDYLFCKDGNEYSLEKMYSNVIRTKPDILLFQIIKADNSISDFDKFKPINIKKIFKTKIKRKYFLKMAYYSPLWCKLIKRKFLKHNKIVFDERLSIADDVDLNFKYMFLTDKIKFINEPYYYHDYYEKSIISSEINNFYKDILVIKTTKETLCKYKIWNTVRCFVIEFWSRVLRDFFIVRNIISENFIEQKKYIRKYLDLLEISDKDMEFLDEKTKSIIIWYL